MQKQLWVALLMVGSLFAQAQKPSEESPKPAANQADNNPSFKRALSLESKTEARGEATIKGQKVPYKVVSGTILFGTKMVKRLPVYFMCIMKELMLPIKTSVP